MNRQLSPREFALQALVAGFVFLGPITLWAAPEANAKYVSFREAYDAGSRLLKDRQFAQSVDAYTQAENLASSDTVKSQAANAAGWALVRARKWVDARLNFRRAVELNPKSKVALGNLGYTNLTLFRYGLGNADDLKEALKALEDCAAIDPAYKDDLLESAKTVAGRLDTNANATPVTAPRAGLSYKEAVALGDEAQSQGQYSLAILCFKKAEASSVSPKAKGAAANRLGLALLESGKPKESLAQFDRAVKLVPAEKVFLNNLGLAHWTLYDAGLGDVVNLKQSVECFFKANTMDPSYHGENLRMALTELRAVDPAAAKPYEPKRDPSTGEVAPMGSPTAD